MNANVADPVLWITWYDLAAADREPYLAWLHESYMRTLADRPGVLWAAHYASEERPPMTAKSFARPRRHPPADAVPGGHRFVLLVGGEGPHVFSDPTPAQVEASLAAADRQMLAKRTALASNVMLEHLRIEGPEARARNVEEALSPCIQLGSFTFDGDEEELIGWYAQWRLPSMTTMPGCIGVRKLVSLAGWAKHAILHEFTSVDARNTHFVDHERRNHPEKHEWSERITGQVVHAPGSPNVATRLHSVTRPGSSP